MIKETFIKHLSSFNNSKLILDFDELVIMVLFAIYTAFTFFAIINFLVKIDEEKYD